VSERIPPKPRDRSLSIFVRILWWRCDTLYTLVLPFLDDVVFAYNGPYSGISTPGRSLMSTTAMLCCDVLCREAANVADDVDAGGGGIGDDDRRVHRLRQSRRQHRRRHRHAAGNNSSRETYAGRMLNRRVASGAAVFMQNGWHTAGQTDGRTPDRYNTHYRSRMGQRNNACLRPYHTIRYDMIRSVFRAI